MIFFMFVGMKLDFSFVLVVVGLVVLYFVFWLIGKFISVFVVMSIVGVLVGVCNYFGLVLLLYGGVVVGLILLV